MFAFRMPQSPAPAAAVHVKPATVPDRDRLVAVMLEPQHVADQLKGRDAVVFAKAEWCPHCRAFDLEFKEMAKRWPFSSAVVLVERQRGDSQQVPEASKFRRQYNISSWPTVLLIRKDGRWTQYKGKRSAEDIEQAATEFFR